MAETVATQWHGVITLADINILFPCIVVKMWNSFSAWEADDLLGFLLVSQRLAQEGYTVLCSH